jgi:hypothetical protein
MISLFLTIRRDRKLTKVGLRLETTIEDQKLILRITNSELRAVTVEKAGLAVERSKTSPFERWEGINPRLSTTGMMRLTDPPLPMRLDPGDGAYPVKAQLYLVKNWAHPRNPQWAWVQDDPPGPR